MRARLRRSCAIFTPKLCWRRGAMPMRSRWCGNCLSLIRNACRQVTALVGQLVDAEQDEAAVSLARKLGQFQAKRGERRQFVGVMQDIASTRRASPVMLEFLSELFNASNREGDYCQTLLKLFDVYCSTGDFYQGGGMFGPGGGGGSVRVGPHEAAGDVEGKD